MNLPFDLKQKPLTHYFNHGLVKFNIHEGKLHYTIKVITKTYNGSIMTGEVISKTHLDELLSIKELSEIHAFGLGIISHEIPTIEEVVN